jgi:hypothetical protein
MKLSTRVEQEFARSPDEVFDLIVDPLRFPEWLKDVGPIPGVVRAEPMGEGPQKVGSKRRIETSDGGAVVEEVFALDRPRHHRYRWEKPKFPFSLIVKSGEGDWHFHPAGRGTRVEWEYTFELTSPLMYLTAKLVVVLFRRWMRVNLARVEDVLGRSRGADAQPRG